MVNFILQGGSLGKVVGRRLEVPPLQVGVIAKRLHMPFDNIGQVLPPRKVRIIELAKVHVKSVLNTADFYSSVS
ncbi:hypothetical protein D0962_18925 [Leptolyngbyaceae cyanobacterium CCMR0082]|uniref:Uncharacterized protein n=1 Tax=Adonisia turfae CCMR0082 TaxID=2304604 RepID=A0A6M0S8N2_9CYAN|nr:hypothetical protein [Adonisia turfae CCMR0082]